MVDSADKPPAAPPEAEREQPSAKRHSSKRGRLLLLGLLLLVAAVLAVTLVDRQRTTERSLGEDLCPLDAARITGSTALLVDLAKPLRDDTTLASLVGTVSRDLRMDEELQIYVLPASSPPAAGATPAPRAPLLLGRICKPYNNEDLLFGPAKDQRGAWRDCDDLPAQLPPVLRDAADRFCAARNHLQTRIDTLAAQQDPIEQMSGAELVQALAAVRTALSQRSAPRKLVIFSDLLQHAAWYSHLDLAWTDWSSADHSAGQADSLPRRETELQVLVFYLPRQAITESLRLRNAHQQFWRSFFGGADVQFDDLPPQPAYAVRRLMPQPQGGEAQDDREELNRLLEATEELRAKVAEARGRLQDLREVPPAAASAPAPEAQSEPPAAAPEAATQQEPTTPTADSPPDASTAAQAQEPPPIPAGDQQPSAVAAATTPNSAAEPATEPAAESPAELAAATATELAEESAPDATPPQAAGLGAPPAPQPSLPLATEATIAQLPSATDDPCAATLRPQFLAQPYFNDRRVNYGSGTVVVDYLLDEDGSTVDAEVVWRSEASSSTRPRSLDALAADAVTAIRAWQVDFEDSPNACLKRQRQRATFTFRSQCVGAPVPSCRTVRDDVEILALGENP